MDGEKVLRPQPLSRIGPAVVGFYAWMLAMLFGAVVLDIVYARLLPQAAAAFSEVADFLLLLSALVILAALAAVGFAWQSPAARNFLIASVAVVGLGLLIPAFLSPLLQGADGPALGTLIRLIVGGLPSVLAFAGLHHLHRHSPQPG